MHIHIHVDLMTIIILHRTNNISLNCVISIKKTNK